MKNIFKFIIFTVTCFLTFTKVYSDKRPNILFAFADDWGKHASIYTKIDGAGTVNDVLHTPNFDKIAKEGVLFKHAFVNSPSCTPCRSSLLSGQHFWRTGKAAILQGAVWDESIPTYPLLLKEHGYHIGKSHKVWSPGIPRDAPYGGIKYAYSKAGRKINGFSQNVNSMHKNGKGIEDAKSLIMKEVRDNFKMFLADRKAGQPFSYWFGPTNVHRKWIKGSGKKLWNIDPDKLKGKMPPFLPDVHAVREDLADYFGEIHAFDMALGVLIEELKKAGEYKNTIIAISGDHGAPGFPHGKCNLYDFGSQVALAITGPGIKGGRIVDDMVSLPDITPTFLETANIKIPSQMTAKSLWPVLTSKSSGLVDSKRTQVYIGRERHVAKARAGNLPYPQRAIRTLDYAFIINFKPDRYPLGDPYNLGTGQEPSIKLMEQNTFVTLPDEDAGPTKAWLVSHRHEWKKYFEHAYGKRPREEFYDLKKDPYQIKNVAHNPTYKKIVDDLRFRLMTELKNTKDPRLIDEGKYFDEFLVQNTEVVKKKRFKKKK